MILTPKNWNGFQHYKDRSPSWIKLHRGLLDDFEFCCLPVASRALAPFLWLLASEYEDGRIDASLDALAFRLRMTRGDLADALSPLIESGFFNASEALAEREQDSIPEKEDIGKRNIEKEEKKETREVALLDDWPSDHRERFWQLYPHKVGRPDALKKLDAARKRGIPWKTLVVGLRDYIRDKPPDRAWCNPATWLHQERWNDQPANVSPTNGKTSNIIAASDKLNSILDSFGAGPSEDHELCGPEGSADVRLLSQG